MTRVEKSKRVLVIAYDFPPKRTSGVYRPTGLLKYLPGLGWEPTVVTVRARPGDVEDPSLLARIPNQVKIVRTRELGLSDWENPAAKTLQNAGFLRPEGGSSRRSLFNRSLRRIASFLRSCVYFPDIYVGWIPFAVWRGRRLARRDGFDALYATGPPRSALVVGLLLKAWLGVPWVAEFRDPWYPTARPIRRRFDHWLLGLIMRSAHSVVVLTEGHREEMAATFPRFIKKVVVLRNGYDEEDFSKPLESADEIFPAGYFHMTHLGTIYPEHSGNFFPALAEVLKEDAHLEQFVRVNVIGYPDDAVARFAADPRLKGVVQLRDFVPHDEALRVMAASDCLLLFWGSRNFSRQAVAGKFYEYLRSGRPIFALAYEGDLKQLIEASRSGWTVEPQDTLGIKKVLRTILHNGKRADPPPPARREFAEQFRYDRLAAKLAEILEATAKHGG